MPGNRRYVVEKVNAYLEKKVKHGRLSQVNADAYRPRIMMAFESLREAGLKTAPARIGEEEIEHLLNVTFAHERASAKKWDISIINGFLKSQGNKVIDDMMLTWPHDARVRVDWLSPEEAVAMLDSAQGVEIPIIHLELRLWMRRIEVRRLKLEDIHELEMFDPMTGEPFEGVVSVHGKGRAGGKWRTLPLAPETAQVFQDYGALREEMIEKARVLNPHVQVPEEYMIYRKGSKLFPYSESGIDSIVSRVARKAGIKRQITNHTLRRTGARIAYYAGVLLVEIMEGLGHTSERETIKYLGLTVHELSRAQLKVRNFLQGVEKKMNGKAPEAPSEGARISG